MRFPGDRGSAGARIRGHDTMANTRAQDFIEQAATHPEWMTELEKDPSRDTLLHVASTHGFECSFEDLQTAAREVVGSGGTGTATTDQQQPDAKQINEAAAGMGDAQEMGYGSDTGYAMYYGLAGLILKLKE